MSIYRGQQENVNMQCFIRQGPSFSQKESFALESRCKSPSTLCFTVYSVLLTRVPLKPIAIAFKVCLQYTHCVTLSGRTEFLISESRT